VIGLVGGTVTAAARSLGHTISFAVTGSMLICLMIYTGYTIKRRYGTSFQKYGPFYLVCIATPLIMADLFRHVLQDSNVWPEPGSAQYRPNCGDETMKCLSVVGVFFHHYHDVCGVCIVNCGNNVECEFM